MTNIYTAAYMSVRMSVRRVAVSLKWLNSATVNQHWTVTHGRCFFLTPNMEWISLEDALNEGPKC